MNYIKPKLVILANPIKTIQGFYKERPYWYFDVAIPDYVIFTPAAYEADE